MAHQFKTVTGIVTTTGSDVALVTCPTGKTLILSTLNLFNNDGSNNATYGLKLRDSSISSTSYAFGAQDFTLNSYANLTAFTSAPLSLESGDILSIRTNVQPIHVWASYALLDNTGRHQYRHVTKNITSEDAYSSILTCPAGSTIIIKYARITNTSGSNASGNTVSLYDSSTSSYVFLDYGTINDDNYAFFSGGYVLEPGDIFALNNSEQPFTVNVFYMEIPIPSIRS